MSDPITAYPLCWPAGWKRTSPSQRTWGRFNKKEVKSQYDPKLQKHTYWKETKSVSIADSVQRVLNELAMLIGSSNRDRIIISTNVEPRLDGLPRSGKEPDDPGVAVYWSTSRNPKQKCMAIDRYTSVADNIAAVAATVSAMRAIERHGGAEILERAFLGFQQLPPPMNGGRPWQDVLQMAGGAQTLANAEELYRELARKYHPDRGGDPAKMAELNDAIRQAREALR